MKPGMLRTVRLGLLAASVGAMAFGFTVKRKVYEPVENPNEESLFRRIGDRQLTIDSTFGGVERAEERLYSTYDRDQPRGKVACPT